MATTRNSTAHELFPDEPTAAAPVVKLPFTVRARLNGWPVEVTISAKPAQLGAYLQRLGELGYEPDAAPLPVAIAPRKARKQAEPPTFDGDGDPCCPVHNRKLKAGRFGLFCTKKTGEDQFCDYRWSDKDAA